MTLEKELVEVLQMPKSDASFGIPEVKIAIEGLDYIPQIAVTNAINRLKQHT